MYGFPVDKAAETAVWAVRDFLEGRSVFGDGDGDDDDDIDTDTITDENNNYNNDSKAAAAAAAAAGIKDEPRSAMAIKAFDRIVFCVFGEADERAYKKWLP